MPPARPFPLRGYERAWGERAVDKRCPMVFRGEGGVSSCCVDMAGALGAGARATARELTEGTLFPLPTCSPAPPLSRCAPDQVHPNSVDQRLMEDASGLELPPVGAGPLPFLASDPVIYVSDFVGSEPGVPAQRVHQASPRVHSELADEPEKSSEEGALDGA